MLLSHSSLHASNERSMTHRSANDPAAKKQRERRHNMRKVLIVVDYAIEFFGGLFILLIFFVGENKVSYSLLYQRILFCIGTFVYGILVPVAYLANECRVRDIIVNAGWTEGFKSIFDSREKIRDLERRANISASRMRVHAASNDGFNGVLYTF